MEVVGRHAGLSDQETKVLDWLEEGMKGLDGRILVEPGYKFKDTKYKKWPDFLVISPTHGILIIECKGHYSEEIREVSNVDLLTTRGVVRYGKQLADYGCLVRDLLKGSGIPFSKFVVFPEILSTDLAAKYINEFNTNHEDVRICYSESLNWSCSMEYLGVNQLGKALNKSEYDELLNRLNPTRVISHNYTIDSETLKEIKVLDDQQMSFIEQIKEGHYLLNGLPGTGKTIMLMKIAERELLKGSSVMYTCYNNPLGEYVASLIGNEVARTTSSLYHKHVRRMGENFINHPESYKKIIEFLLNNNPEPEYDVLLIDEYQDLDDDDYTILMKLLKPGGLLVLAGDKLQNIRGNKETWKSKGINVPGKRSKFLKKPYRTDPEIVDFALQFLCTSDALEKEARRYFVDNEFHFQEGEFENLHKKLNFRVSPQYEFEQELAKVIESKPGLNILIITPHQGLKNSLLHFQSRNVKVETFLRAKGLEADIVILYNIDSYKNYKNKFFELSEEQKMRSIFSALCRSRGDVYIHAHEPKDYFEELKRIYNFLQMKKVA